MLNKIFTLLFAFSTALSFSQGQVVEKIVAKVDKEIILLSDLEQATLEFKKSNQLGYVENLQCRVFETLVINKLLVAKAAEDSIIVTKEEVEQQLDLRMRQILAAYGGDEQILIKNYGKTIYQLKDELRDRVREQMIVQRMQNTITQDVKITPIEVKRFYKKIPKDSLPFYSSELELAQIIRFPKAGEAENKEVYNKLVQLKNDILAEKVSFESMAKAYSMDYGSAVQGGEIGFQSSGNLVPEYEAAALNLAIGEISDPVKTEYGFHIIQLLEKRGREFNTRHILIKPTISSTGNTTAKKTLDSLRTAILADSISFSKAAHKFSEDERTKAYGGRITDQEGNSKVATNNVEVIGPDIYFLVDKMKAGEISSPIAYTAPDGTKGWRIIQVISKTPAHEANLEDDYQKIYNATLSSKKNKEIDKWFLKTKEEIYIQTEPEYKHCKISMD